MQHIYSTAKKAWLSPFILLSLLFMLLFSFLYGEELAALIGQRAGQHSILLDVDVNREHQQPAGVEDGWKRKKKRWHGRLAFAVNDEDEDEEGDVFSGSWVRDEEAHPLYREEECPYIQPQLTCQAQGRPDKG